MSTELILIVIMTSSIALILIGFITINMIRYVRYNKYEKEYKIEHGIEMNAMSYDAINYANEKLHIRNLYGLGPCDQIALLYIGVAMMTIVLLIVAAESSANENLDKLSARRKQMAQNASITRHADLDAITEFNNEVFAAYNEIPPIDRKLFVDNERNIYEELIIPYDETWYEQKA